MFTNVQEAEKISAYQDIKETLLAGERLDFEVAALDLFQIQYQHNPVYRQWCDHLDVAIKTVNSVDEIPFLPINFFKQKHLSIYKEAPDFFFRSSGTGGYGESKHGVYDADFYDKHSQVIFEKEYGKLSEYCVLALLPAYLERKGSSLVRMSQHFIKESNDPDSGFFLNDLKRLSVLLERKQAESKPCLLLGVSFALWDLAEQFPMDLSQIVIMETGGMKGKRKEILRQDLHHIFNQAFGTSMIHSEYGMTELFSQAYSKGNGLFKPAASMRVFARQLQDPFSYVAEGKTGGLNIVDLANLDSCPFIESQDLGRVSSDHTFEVLGRFDQSELRGCNLMIEKPTK
jgi:hypothetical protein